MSGRTVFFLVGAVFTVFAILFFGRESVVWKYRRLLMPDHVQRLEAASLDERSRLIRQFRNWFFLIPVWMLLGCFLDDVVGLLSLPVLYGLILGVVYLRQRIWR